MYLKQAYQRVYLYLLVELSQYSLTFTVKSAEILLAHRHASPWCLASSPISSADLFENYVASQQIRFNLQT